MNELEAYFKGLADRTRLRLINLLLQGERCGCDLQRLLGITQPNVSRHLIYLKHVGLLVDRRDGFRVFYRLAPTDRQPLKGLVSFLAAAFRDDPILRNDRRRLKQALRQGACVVPSTPAAPDKYAALQKGKLVRLSSV